MKQVLLAIFLCVFFVGCDAELGGNFKHLQEQNPTGLRRVNFDNGTIENVGERERVGGVYEELNENLCELSPECCGDLTDEQKNFRDKESQAIIERNIELCYDLPIEPFIISCDGEEDTILYSRTRCLESFEE